MSFPITPFAQDRIESIVASITGSFFGIEPYLLPEEKAVAYLYFLIKDHPFTDGNKRTASIAFDTLCLLNNLQPDYEHYPLDKLAVFIEKVQAQDHQMAIKTIARALFTKAK